MLRKSRSKADSRCGFSNSSFLVDDGKCDHQRFLSTDSRQLGKRSHLFSIRRIQEKETGSQVPKQNSTTEEKYLSRNLLIIQESGRAWTNPRRQPSTLKWTFSTLPNADINDGYADLPEANTSVIAKQDHPAQDRPNLSPRAACCASRLTVLGGPACTIDGMFWAGCCTSNNGKTNRYPNTDPLRQVDRK